jgi:hypothetical protein
MAARTTKGRTIAIVTTTHRPTALRALGVLAAAVPAGVMLVTLAALEGHDVRVLETTTAAGAARRTRVWVADGDGALWVEAAADDRPFHRDLLAHPRVALVHHRRRAVFTATPVPGRAAHAALRALLRAKYGWADAWIGIFQDTSASIPIRLDPVATAAE